MKPGPRTALVVLGYAAVLGVAYRFVFRGFVVASDDAMRMAIPDASFLLECLRAREWPLWTPYARLGQPFAASLHSQAFYLPRALAAVVAGPVWGITLEQLFHAAVAALGTFAACRSVGRSRLASFAAGAAFAIGPLYASLMFVPNMAGSVAWSGALFAAGRHFARRPSTAAAMPLGAFGAASLLAGSPETFLWQAALLFVGLPSPRPASRTAGLALALLFSGALAACALVPAMAFVPESIRAGGVPDPFRWSARPASLLALFWLNADLPRAAGDQNLFAFLYQGMSVFALACVAGLRRGVGRRIGLLALGLALLALGEHFLPARAVLSMPPFSLFRYPVKYLAGTGFCICIAASFGLDQLRARLRLRRWWRASRRAHLWLGTLMVSELAVLSLLWGGLGWAPASVVSASSPLARHLPNPLGGRVSALFTDESLRALWPSAKEQIEHSRQALVPMRNAEEHVAIVEGYGPPEPRLHALAFQEARRGLYDLAGVSHYVHEGAPPFEDLVSDDEAQGAAPRGIRVSRADTALPRAYLVHAARTATDDEALAALQDARQPFRTMAFLANASAVTGDGTGPSPAATACSGERIRWKSATAHRLVLELSACAPGHLVLTDAYAPGWEATRDDEPVPVLRAQLLVRAVPVPAGDHTVVFEYRPKSARLGMAISGLAVLGALAGWLRSRLARVRLG